MMKLVTVVLKKKRKRNKGRGDLLVYVCSDNAVELGTQETLYRKTTLQPLKSARHVILNF